MYDYQFVFVLLNLMLLLAHLVVLGFGVKLYTEYAKDRMQHKMVSRPENPS